MKAELSQDMGRTERSHLKSFPDLSIQRALQMMWPSKPLKDSQGLSCIVKVRTPLHSGVGWVGGKKLCLDV